MQPEHSATRWKSTRSTARYSAHDSDPDHQHHRFRRPRQCRLRQTAIHERPRIYRGRIRSRRRPVLSRLQRLRDSEQPPSREDRRATDAVANHGPMGRVLGRIGVDVHACTLLHSAIVARCGGSRLLPGRPLLSDNVDSGVPARPLHRHVHVGDRYFRRDQRTDSGLDHAGASKA